MSVVAEHIEPAPTPGSRTQSVIKAYDDLRKALFPILPDIRLKEAITKKIDNAEQSSIRAVTQHRA